MGITEARARSRDTVKLGSRASCLGVARTFSIPYHTALGAPRQIEASELGLPGKWGRQLYTLMDVDSQGGLVDRDAHSSLKLGCLFRVDQFLP